MHDADRGAAPLINDDQWFATTHWSVVLAARHRDSPEAQAALDKLCQRYWRPIYAFIRRRGHKLEDSQDLTQEFFARFIEKDYVHAADSSKGRFRTLLLTAVSRFLVNEWERSQTQKRGGKVVHFSLEDCMAQEGGWLEPAESSTPETIYQRSWAESLLKSVLDRLRAEMASDGKRERFELLKPFLAGEKDVPSGSELATRLGVTESTVYSLVHRLRQRFSALLREEVAHTVDSPQEIEDELRHLLAALSMH